MKKLAILSMAAAVALPAAARAETTLPPLPSMAAIKAQLAEKADETGSVWLHIRPGPQAKTYTLEDPFLRIRIEGRNRGDNEFYFDGWLDSGWFNLDARPIFNNRRDYALSGFGTNLDLREWGNFGKDFLLSGNLRTNDNRTVYLNVAFHYDEYRKSYSVSGDGLGVTLESWSGWELRGNVDFRRCPREGLAAVAVASALIVHNRKPERPEPKETKDK